jgi:O-acetyl-ADP-ribose deacetylase (regulator of RNase III)
LALGGTKSHESLGFEETQMKATPEELPILQAGQVFHGLEVHSLLGKGAMGAAYLSSHQALHMPMVIKVLPANAEQQLFQEACLAARVRSPNVVTVLDAGKEDGIPFIIQHYIDGLDLSEIQKHLSRWEHSFPLSVLASLLSDIAQGLYAIHQVGVIHRDIKPSNLFLNGNGIAMVGDFGIASEIGMIEGNEVWAGTPEFMAPEQWNKGTVDGRTDLYSLGATAHTLARGKAPFYAENIWDMGLAHLKQPYSSPACKSPDEAYFFAIIEKLLAKDAHERYRNAHDVARAWRMLHRPPPSYVSMIRDTARVGELAVRCYSGNLCEIQSDVLVSASNTKLTMRLGVADMLRAAGGDEIEVEAMSVAPVGMGDVIWTRPGKLKTKHIAHAVAALNGAICIQRAVLRVLFGAEQRKASTIAFPALGTGVGEVPVELCASLMLEAIRTFATFQPVYVRRIDIVLWGTEILDRWRLVQETFTES